MGKTAAVATSSGTAVERLAALQADRNEANALLALKVDHLRLVPRETTEGILKNGMSPEQIVRALENNGYEFPV